MKNICHEIKNKIMDMKSPRTELKKFKWSIGKNISIDIYSFIP